MNLLLFKVYFYKFYAEWLANFFMDDPHISGVRIFAVITGDSSEEDLQASKPDCIIKDLSELERKIKGVDPLA